MNRDSKTLEERWGLALQNAAFGVWDYEPLAGRVHYSPEWKAMLGYGDLPDEQTERTEFWRNRVHADDLPRMLEALQAHLDGRATGYAVEFRLRAADGNWRWVLSRGRVVERDAQGRALRVVGTLTDLSERRELEAARLAQGRAEAQMRAKTDFVSRMSHELRTPLNAVLGFAQLLSHRLGDGDVAAQREYVRHIERAGWHLLSMINDVLDLSMAEAGQLEMQFEAVELAPFWLALRASVSPPPGAPQVQLHTDALPPAAAVRADPARLKQVLAALLDNAIKYNREGGSVRFGVAAAGRCWRLRIADTGQGIPKAQQQHLFEPFNRLGRKAGGVDGVGVGLVLARHLVEQMGGTIAVHSEPGAGTVVEVDLPIATPAP